MQESITWTANNVKQDLPPCDVRFTQPQHVDGSLVQLEEGSIVNLSQSEQLHHFTWAWVNSIDTEIYSKFFLIGDNIKYDNNSMHTRL